MSQDAAAFDWEAIGKTFAFTSLGRETGGERYFQPIRYTEARPAPSASHQELSTLLWQLRPLILRPDNVRKPADIQRIAELEAAVEVVKRRIWAEMHGQPASDSKGQLSLL